MPDAIDLFHKTGTSDKLELATAIVNEFQRSELLAFLEDMARYNACEEEEAF